MPGKDPGGALHRSKTIQTGIHRRRFTSPAKETGRQDYINELIPFCDPGAEEEHTSTPTQEHYLFPSLVSFGQAIKSNTHSYSGLAAS